MSQSSTHALSTRLFIQAALTGLLAPTAAGGSTWLVITLAVAAGAVAVALLLRNAPSNAKAMVLGFEAVALVVGGLGLAGGHYIPGTIIGVITFITALNLPAGSVAAAESDSTWVAPPGAVQAPPGYGPPVAAPTGFAAPVAAAPDMESPYATPAPPVMANPYAPPAPPVEAVVPPQAPPAPVEAPEPATPMRPEDIAPAPRAMTILPGG